MGGYRIKKSSKRNKRGGSGLFGSNAAPVGYQSGPQTQNSWLKSISNMFGSTGQGPNAYQDPNGGYQGANGGYQGANGGYQGANGGYQGANGGYQDPNGGYQDPNGGYQGASAQDPNGGYQGASAYPDPGAYPGQVDNGQGQLGGRSRRGRGGCWFGMSPKSRKVRRGRKKPTKRRR